MDTHKKTKTTVTKYKITEEGYLHRTLYLKHYKSIPTEWHIHHIDGNSLNNELSNLIAVHPRTHTAIHERQRKFKNLLNRDQITKLNKLCLLAEKSLNSRSNEYQTYLRTIYNVENESSYR